MAQIVKKIDRYPMSESRGMIDGERPFLLKPVRWGTFQMPPLHLTQLETQEDENHRFGQIVGRSSAMQRVYQIIERVAPTHATVLISGRTGTGKELVARAIHLNSQRGSRPFVDINCGALPEQLAESELFGHQKGAFTGATETKKGLFETAQGGTIFFDEVQALKPELQAKLLRALQERVIRRVGGRENIEIDVRVIAATNQDIVEAVHKGEFREDLFYRLNVVNIHMPELRERREDIPLLIDHFLKRFAEKNNGEGQEGRRFSNEAVRLLLSSDWPGNVRELENAVEHACAIGIEPTLRISDLPPQISGLVRKMGSNRPLEKARSLEEVERHHILFILEETGDNHVCAAEILGIDRRTLYRKLDKYKVQMI
jgi:two-component system, NtrC family, response regulator HydG